MAIVGTDHTVMLVQDIDAAIVTYRDRLGLDVSHRVDHMEAGIRQAFFSLPDRTFIELIAPAGENSRFESVLRSMAKACMCSLWRSMTWRPALPSCRPRVCNWLVPARLRCLSIQSQPTV